MKLSMIVALGPLAGLAMAYYDDPEFLYERRSTPYLAARSAELFDSFDEYGHANELARRGFMSRMKGGMPSLRGGGGMPGMAPKQKLSPVQLDHVKPRPPMSNPTGGSGVPDSPWANAAPSKPNLSRVAMSAPMQPLHKAGPRVEFPRDDPSVPRMPTSPFVQAAQQPFPE